VVITGRVMSKYFLATIFLLAPMAHAFELKAYFPQVHSPFQDQAEVAIDQLNAAVQDGCIEREVRAATFTEANGYTSAEIWELIRTAYLSPRVTFYWRSRGWAYTDDKNDINLNRKVWGQASVTRQASTILHESMHLLGFSHFGVWATSVPYQMNAIYERCAGTK
jgi:hypothetical protein